jgi:formiminoglutamase
LRNTDWLVDELYGFVRDLGATTVRTRVSRTVIDVNRDPWGASLYPGQATTELCPTTTFDSEPLYHEGREPDAADIAARRRRWFTPYHEALAAELERLRRLHPRVVLYDCHSIRSRIPRLFEGELPHLNLGTNAGASCAPTLTAAIETACRSDPDFTTVVDGPGSRADGSRVATAIRTLVSTRCRWKPRSGPTWTSHRRINCRRAWTRTAPPRPRTFCVVP